MQKLSEEISRGYLVRNVKPWIKIKTRFIFQFINKKSTLLENIIDIKYSGTNLNEKINQFTKNLIYLSDQWIEPLIKNILDANMKFVQYIINNYDLFKLTFIFISIPKSNLPVIRKLDSISDNHKKKLEVVKGEEKFTRYLISAFAFYYLFIPEIVNVYDKFLYRDDLSTKYLINGNNYMNINIWNLLKDDKPPTFIYIQKGKGDEYTIIYNDINI